MEQIRHAGEKASKSVRSLSRLITNTLLYGAEVWADRLEKEYQRKVLARV
jgi:hypothetical protein